MNKTEIMIALIDPAARPALTVAGAFFLIINLLGGAYILRHWRRLFGRDEQVDGDKRATRYFRSWSFAFRCSFSPAGCSLR